MIARVGDKRGDKRPGVSCLPRSLSRSREGSFLVSGTEDNYVVGNLHYRSVLRVAASAIRAAFFAARIQCSASTQDGSRGVSDPPVGDESRLFALLRGSLTSRLRTQDVPQFLAQCEAGLLPTRAAHFESCRVASVTTRTAVLAATVILEGTDQC